MVDRIMITSMQVFVFIHYLRNSIMFHFELAASISKLIFFFYSYVAFWSFYLKPSNWASTAQPMFFMLEK